MQNLSFKALFSSDLISEYNILTLKIKKHEHSILESKISLQGLPRYAFHLFKFPGTETVIDRQFTAQKIMLNWLNNDLNNFFICK